MHASQNIIYTLAEPDGETIRYVGKSVSGLRRAKAHLWAGKLQERTHCAAWLRSLLARGQNPAISILEEVSRETLDEAERYWIAQMKAWGFSITNHTAGGDGSLGHKWTEERRQKFIKATTGRKRTSEFCAHMREVQHRRVAVIDSHGREYPSMSAAARELSISPFAIRDAVEYGTPRSGLTFSRKGV